MRILRLQIPILFVYRRYSKRILDVMGAAFLLGIALPVMILIALMLALANQGRVLFIQQRPGYRGKPFGLIKFRTMTDAQDEYGNPLADAQRITPLGKWLRVTSLDELPQLINVLKGELSLVGPRPLLMEYLPLYNPQQNRRHDVKPGLTGWAQIHGRNAQSWPERLAYDIWYVDNMSWQTDWQILLRTVGKVVRREGVYAADGKSMERFSGKQG